MGVALSVGVAYPWGVLTLVQSRLMAGRGVASMGGGGKAKVSLLAKPFELQYKGGEETRIHTKGVVAHPTAGSRKSAEESENVQPHQHLRPSNSYTCTQKIGTIKEIWLKDDASTNSQLERELRATNQDKLGLFLLKESLFPFLFFFSQERKRN